MMNVPWESLCAWTASWAARKTSSCVPGPPATEPTPPALLLSPVTCHAAKPIQNATKKKGGKKTNHASISKISKNLILKNEIYFKKIQI